MTHYAIYWYDHNNQYWRGVSGNPFSRWATVKKKIRKLRRTFQVRVIAINEVGEESEVEI